MTDIYPEVRSLLSDVMHLRASLAQAGGDEQQLTVGARLANSVVRPLRLALGVGGAEGEVVPPTDDLNGDALGPSTAPDRLSDRVWELALSATALLASTPELLGLMEAVAALQDLALALADEATATARMDALVELQSELGSQVQVAHDGPYLVTNLAGLDDWLGQPVPVRPQMALCRCGASQTKPLCDGAHATIGFSGAKDPTRAEDRLDTYVGQQVTVLDNRGTCQHSGFCTDRLATVFHLDKEPFVTASGGRMDEIIRVVRACPSGALGLALDGKRAQDEVDHHGTRGPRVEVSRDGPYRVTGGIDLVDHAGVGVSRNAGASLEHYALCRCGHSKNKPFCSGMHWYVGFRDPVLGLDHEATMFEWAGGLPALTRMTRVFYEKYVPQDPLLAPLFATMSADHPERVAKWLSEVFCGPKVYSEECGGYSRMLSQHIGKCLTEEQRARWVALLVQSAHDAGLPNDAEFRSAFGAYIEWGSRLAVENSQTSAKPPEHMPMPRWDWQTAAGPPGSRAPAQPPTPHQAEEEVALPSADEPVSFDQHIKGMFRPNDRQSMTFAFDLWSYEAVSTHAEAILERLRAGTMPCDGAWPQARVEVFQRWVQSGKAS